MIFGQFEITHFKYLCYVYNSRAVVQKKYAQIQYMRNRPTKEQTETVHFPRKRKKMEMKTTKDDF